jgi:hypothetical protein
MSKQTRGPRDSPSTSRGRQPDASPDPAVVRRLLRQCREYPELPTALHAAPWMPEAVAAWYEAKYSCYGMAYPHALAAVVEVMRITSLEAMTNR